MKILTRLGRLIRVKNTKTKSFTHENDTYIAIWVGDWDGANKRCILFTDKEITRAEERAQKNAEDLTEKSLISKLLD